MAGRGPGGRETVSSQALSALALRPDPEKIHSGAGGRAGRGAACGAGPQGPFPFGGAPRGLWQGHGMHPDSVLVDAGRGEGEGFGEPSRASKLVWVGGRRPYSWAMFWCIYKVVFLSYLIISVGGRGVTRDISPLGFPGVVAPRGLWPGHGDVLVQVFPGWGVTTYIFSVGFPGVAVARTRRCTVSGFSGEGGAAGGGDEVRCSCLVGSPGVAVAKTRKCTVSGLSGLGGVTGYISLWGCSQRAMART